MFITSFGAFNGTSWENLCQLVFKRKYNTEGYQQIPVSPGDYGLEGFTSSSGLGFQCYCPEKQYSQNDLYIHQRKKITDDILKLKTNSNDLSQILGSTKIKQWVFVTPVLASNALLRHARKKEREVKSWSLSIIDQEFKILLYDADHYIVEINQIQSAQGLALDFCSAPPILDALNEPQIVYEKNINKKCIARLEPALNLPSYQRRLTALYDNVLQSFVEADPFLRRIEQTEPTLHFKLVRLINEYAIMVSERTATWFGTAEDLTNDIAKGLTARIVKDLHPSINETTASQISRHIVARWLAICQLDYE